MYAPCLEKILSNENLRTVGLESGKMLKKMQGHTPCFIKYMSMRIYIHTLYIHHILKKSRQMKIFILQVWRVGNVEVGSGAYVLLYEIWSYTHIHMYTLYTLKKSFQMKIYLLKVWRVGKCWRRWGDISYYTQCISTHTYIYTHYIHGENAAKWKYTHCRSEEWESVEGDEGKCILLYEIYQYTHIYIYTHYMHENIPPNESIHAASLKSGKMLKEMRGHTSYINHCVYTMDGLRLVSSGTTYNEPNN